ncbi:MAG: tetratricopeptide repeat protein, partial [Cyanobacteria bacterium J06641_5]
IFDEDQEDIIDYLDLSALKRPGLEKQGSQQGIDSVGSIENRGTINNDAGQARDQFSFGDNAQVTINNSPEQRGTGGAPNNLLQFAVPEGQFLGREEQLKQLQERLNPKQRVAVVAVAGMGGIGKTELALQFALRHADAYPGGMCWLQAQGDVSDQIVGLAREFHDLVVPEDLPEQKRPRWCWQHWPPGKTLVVFDDVLNYASMQAWLPPQKKQFDVILTSRLQEPVNLEILDLDVLAPKAALALLERLAGAERIAEAPGAATGLCEWLGYLPLGLELVGSYLARRSDVTVAQVQAELQARRADAPAAQAMAGVAAAFELSWEQLSPEGQMLWVRLGLFAGAPFKWEWVGADPDGVLRDAELLPWHLVQRLAQGTYKLHPLVREFLQVKRQGLPNAAEIEAAFCKEMVAIAQQIPQAVTLEIVAVVREAIPHIQEVMERYLAATTDEDLLGAYTGLMFYYNGQGLYETAQGIAERCIENVKERLGNEHDAYATALTWRGFLYKSQGKYEEAQPLYEEALELIGRVLGQEHPDYACSLLNVAYLFLSQGKYEEAQPLYEEALELRGRVLGQDHPNYASSLNNLAGLYSSQGKYEEAQPLYEGALELWGRVLGRDHPNYASSLNNLAGLYSSQGKYEEAQPLYEEARELTGRVLGQDHPDYATSLNNLAGLYRAQGKYEEAKPLYEEALELFGRVLGQDHPDYATSLNNLAYLYASRGDSIAALPLMQQAVAIRRAKLGDAHPRTQGSVQALQVIQQEATRPAWQKALLQVRDWFKKKG